MNALDFVKNLYKKIIKKDKFEAVEDKSFKDFVAVINLAIGFKYSGYFALIPSNLNIDEHLERYPLTNYKFREMNGKIVAVSNNGIKIAIFDKNRMLYMLDLLSFIPASN